VALSAPVKALAPLAFETHRPRYRVTLEPVVAEVVIEVWPPLFVEMAEYVPPEVAESCNWRIAGCTKFVLTKTFNVPEVVVKL